MKSEQTSCSPKDGGEDEQRAPPTTTSVH
jgi:hypothetical protein